jgi:hypothetical protein
MRLEKGRSIKGLSTLLLMECPGDDLNRLGIWFGPAPQEADEDQATDYTGTLADEEVIGTFMSHFALCSTVE